ncbi:HDAC1 [Symbiodinium sp. CCMP2592]|nr:HDAC1 [Symbiodinium sp. CCMP2592]
MAEPAIFRLPDPGDGELEDRESESEAEEAPRSAGALRTVRYRDRLRNASRAEVLFLYAKTCGDESESLGTAAAGNYLFCVAELGGKCIKPLGAQEHLQQQDTWRARRQKRRDRDFAAKQMSLQNQTTRNQMFKCCLKSLFRFRAAVQLGPAQAAVAGAWCRAPAAANQGAVTPVPAMPALAGRLAVLPAGQAQWVFQAAAPSVIFEAVADRQGLYTCFADGQAAEPEVGTARRYLGRPFWMVRLPPTVMKHLMEIGKEFVVPGGLVTSLGHQLPGTVPAAAEGSPSDGADSGSSSSCEMKKVRRPAMQEILLGKLAYKLSSTVGIQDVVRTVLRMLVPDSLGLADNMKVSHGHVRNILLKLDALHSLSRRFLAPPGGGADKSLRIVRYISPDSSPQANYDYFCATEELLLYRSDELPRDAGGNVAPFKGFEHQRRSMLCTTIARGQGSTASKASKMVHMIAVESGASLFETYRSEVRGFLSDQGTERGIASFPVRSCSEVQSIVGAQALASEAIQEDFRELPLFHSALHIPGTLHIVFNALEFSLKQLETWQKFEKQLNSITRVCKEKSYSEVILVRMMKHASPEERRLLHRMDDLLDWRWDSLARVLKVWVPLYPTFKKYWNPAVFGGDSSSVTIRAVTEALADECHFDMAVWTHQFSAEATRLAHFFEGCHCHQEQLTDPENREKINCCWKGRRLPWLAVGNLQGALQDAMTNNEISVLAHLLSRSSETASRMAHMADTCNKVFVAVIQQKLAYAQQVPWVFAAAFAGYMGETWGRVKKVLRPHLQNVDNMISSGQVGALDSVTHALFGPTDTGRMLREFLNSEDDVPLDRWPALFWRVQEYAFVSLSERHTEREHVGVKVAANRGLTKAGPAVVCSRKRRDQVLEMLEDEKQLAFLVNNWRSRRLWSSLLEHMLTHEEVRLMDTPKRLSRLYGYSEEDHFKDCEDSVRADAVYRQTLRDQTLLLAGSFKLPSASHQVVNWLKGHLATGVFFSVSTHVFELLVDRGRRCEDPAASFRTDVLLSILRADVHPRVSDRASVFCSVLDARPEARTDARVSRPAAHITDPKLGRRSCVVVQRFHDVDVSQGVHGLGGDVRVACTNVRIEVLDLARVCTAENLKAFCANCLLWRAMPAELALALGDESTQPGLLQEPQVQKLPEIVLDSDPACLLSRPPPDPHVEDALDILHPPAHVVQNADDSAVLQVYGAPCSDGEMQAIKELLRARAIGIESAVYATDLEHFDAVALEGLRDRGLVICETDMFSDVSVALTGKLTYSASLVLARPLLLWELDQTTLTRGQMPGRSKLELIRLLFVLGWEPGLGREAWHRKQGEKRLPDDVLVCSLPFLRALMLSRLIWEKPGNLSGIYLKGPQQYYEFLVDQDDLSSLRDASAEEINARFAQKKKRPAGRSLTRDAATGLELDPEADDAELEELVQELPEKLMQAEEPQPSMASGGRRVAPLEIDLGGLLPFCLLGKCEQLTTAELKLTLRWVPVVYNQWGEAQLPHRPPALLPPHPPAAAAPFAGAGAAHGAATGGGVAANPSGAAAMPAPKKNPGQVDLSSEDDDEESEEEEAAKKDEDKEPDSQSRKDDIVVVDHDQEKKKEEKGGKKEEAAQKRKKKKESSSSSGGNSESSSKKEKPRAAPAAKEAKQAHEAQADEKESGKAKEPKEDKEAEAAEGEPAARPARKNRSRHSADEADVVRCEHCWMCVKKEGLQSHLENSEYCRQWRLHAAGQNVAGQKPAEEQASSGACQCRHCSRQFMRRWDMLQHCLGTHPNSDEAKECLQAMHNKRKKQPSKEDRAASMSQHRPPVQLRSRGRVEEPPHRRGPRREESRDDDGSRGRRRSRGESRQSRGQASSRGGGQASSRGSRKGGGQASSRGSRKSSRGSEHMDRRFSGRSRSRRASEPAASSGRRGRDSRKEPTGQLGRSKSSPRDRAMVAGQSQSPQIPQMMLAFFDATTKMLDMQQQ